MYRLHLDLPLGEDLENAQKTAEQVIGVLKSELSCYGLKEKLTIVQYKLCFDDDRRNHNYLDINENGHTSNKKLIFEIL